MPYKTKAERERENWKTIPEVVAGICAADDCQEKAARNLLRKALADDGLGPLRWQLEKHDRIPQKPWGVPLAVPDDLPPRGQVWLKAKIRWKTGRVRDDWGDYNNGKWRVLLIHRLRAAQHWPQSPPRSGSSATNALPFASSGEEVAHALIDVSVNTAERGSSRPEAEVVRPAEQRPVARKTGPKSGKLQSVIAAMKEDIRVGRQTTDAIRVMSDKELVSAYGARSARTTCREARERVVSEFDGIKSRQIAAKDK
jgi:hypothetical protein